LIIADHHSLSINKDQVWIDGLSIRTQEKFELTSRIESLFEQLEGISSEFDEWINEKRKEISDSANFVQVSKDTITSKPVAEPLSISVEKFRLLHAPSTTSELTEAFQQEIANELSRLRWLKIRVENAPATKKSTYRLNGSIFYDSPNRVISVQLVDCMDENRIFWSIKHKFVGDLNYSHVNEFATQIAKRIDPEIGFLEYHRAFQKHHPERSANEELMLAAGKIYAFEKSNWFEAGESIERAKNQLADDARVLSFKALHLVTGLAQGWTKNNENTLAEIEQISNTAILSDPHNSIALSVHGHLKSFVQHRSDEALDLFKKAEMHNPNCGLTQVYKSLTLAYLGNVDESFMAISKARDTLVYDPYWSFIDACDVVASFFSKNFEKSVILANKVLLSRPTFTNIRKIKLISLYCLEREAEANTELQVLLEQEPNFNLTQHFLNYPFYDPNFKEFLKIKVNIISL